MPELTNSQRTCFKAAKAVSEFANYWKKNIKIGCVVVYKHRIISSGYNSNKTNPTQAKYNSQRFIGEGYPHRVHAEIHALSPLLKDKLIDWSKVKIYTYREKADGKLGCSRPCKSCLALIKDLGIKEIGYTTDEGFATEKLTLFVDK